MPRRFIAASYAACVGCLILAGRAAGVGLAFSLLLIPAAALMAWQVARLDPASPASCLLLFRLNRETGLAVAAALLAARL
jgi:4-hydroxybenzoate polyprenyltransferase